MKPTELNKIQQAIEDETLDAWQDKRFNPLNERYLPAHQQTEPDTDFRDSRFSQPPASAKDLRGEILEFVNSGDPDAIALLQAAGIQDEAAKTTFRTRTTRGEWAGTCEWDSAQKRWTFVVMREDGEKRVLFIEGNENSTDAAKVAAAGELSEADKTADIRILGPNQYLLIQRLAARDPEDAFAQGLALLFADYGEEPGFNPYDTIAREENQEALQQLCWVVFTGSSFADKLGADDLEEFKLYASRFIGNRPWNLHLLRAALNSFQNEKVNANLQKLDAQSQQSEQIDFDDLSDEEIDALYDSVSATYIKSLKRNRR